MLKLTQRCCSWTIALILILTVILTTQLLRHTRDQDGALIPPEWQDWVTSHWRGGDQNVTDDQPPSQLELKPESAALPEDTAEHKSEQVSEPEPENVSVPESEHGSEPELELVKPMPTPDAHTTDSETQETSAAPTSATDDAAKVSETVPPAAPTVEEQPSKAAGKPTPTASKKPWPWQKPKKPAASKNPSRPSPTAASEILETQVPKPANFDATSQMFDLNGPPEHNPEGPRPDQIVILTATDGHGHNEDVKHIVDMALHNRREYCAHHGYVNHFINMSRLEVPAHPVWKKLPAIIETFQTYPEALWVWWLDLDAIIMTLDFKIEEKILSDTALSKVLMKHEEYKKNQQEGYGLFTSKKPDVSKADMLIAQDQSTLNAGSFMLRRSEWTQMMLDVWRDPLFMDRGWPMEEQDALIHIVRTNPEIRSHVGLVGPRVLNEYLFGFHDGDLMVHFAGCWVRGQCQEHWDAMWKKRYGTLDWPMKAAANGDVGTEKRRARRRARGEMDALEQIARGYYG